MNGVLPHVRYFLLDAVRGYPLNLPFRYGEEAVAAPVVELLIASPPPLVAALLRVRLLPLAIVEQLYANRRQQRCKPPCLLNAVVLAQLLWRLLVVYLL